MTTFGHLTEKEILSTTLAFLPERDLMLLKILGTKVEYGKELWKVSGVDMTTGFVTLSNNCMVIETSMHNVKVSEINFK